ncbi:hypothetical protein NERG_00002 [Nematocida ausubeli]|uniref:Uncharacterized protein n=1 Tax=Nematocida ausubeli (strain ATCC PRA-371 / ERTm2) TaxID=1913371 RepID=H8Z8T2_NEMA1|nr:hypothetical protein NERG_00002 [Nematocida ausubeli]
MKTRSSVIWIKVVALISVLLMSTHRTDMTLDEVEATLQFEIATDTTPIRINPEGPLNLLRGYIYQKMDCMYNKRFFAPQIKTEYSLEENEGIPDIDQVYLYTRKEQKDKAYKEQPTNKTDTYTEKYHNHLIELFPSPTGDITIETRGNQSFVQFLRAETTEKHALQILAMLLLFSEGVDIPIEVTNSLLKVYEKDKKNEIYFTVPMEIPWLNLVEDKVQTFQQKKVRQMISFFQKNATNHEVLSIMEDKCTKEEIMSGKFLDSPKFLIQSYIFGFIDSAERATEFIQAVHIMTEKYAPKTEAPSKDDSVYDRLFKPTSTEAGTDCMALMKSTQEILNTYRVFPFADSTQLPSYTSVPWRDPTTKEFSTNRLQNYSNCVECMILSLFCCLAYDPSDFTYKTDHMGNVSESLEEFFSPENQPFDTTKANFQKNWCRVVACLDEPRISYCENRNELDCGIINMLMVIAEIVNISKEEKDKVFDFEQSLKEEEGVLENSLSKNIQEYTKILLKRLSKTENLEIELSELKSNMGTGGRYDVYGRITMLFKQDGIKNTIVLGISKGHSTIDMQPVVMDFEDDRIEKLNGIAGICKNTSVFVGNLFSTYVGYEVRKLDTYGGANDFMKEQVRKTIENNFADINRLLLIKKINDLDYKEKLVTCSIVYSMNQNLSPEHPIVRFASNIIGSTELNNWEIQSKMLPSIILAGLLDKNSKSLSYPNINLDEITYESIIFCIQHYTLAKYVLDCDISIFIVWIKYCIVNFNLDENGIYKSLDLPFIDEISGYIFKDQNMEYADAVDEAIARYYPEMKDEILNDLHYAWFVSLALWRSSYIELIKTNFEAIQNPKYIPASLSYDSKKEIAEALTKLKDQVCTSEDSITKFNELLRQYNPDSTTS